MNITKMSLVAALLIGSSAMALDNTKVSGDANLYYQTSDNAGTNDFFESGSSAADISVNLNLTTDVMKTDSVAVSAGVGFTVLTTLGIEGQMVDKTWASSHNGTEDANWVNEAWFAATAAKTTIKAGRMALDTPLLFTETWSIEENTFEGAVLINQDIADTTVVGAYVGRGNGSTTDTATSTAGVVANNGTMSTFGVKGAYAVGAINNSWKPLTAQAWFYDVVAAATATWIQTDLDLATLGAKGLTLGGQYTTLSANETSAYAVTAGYTIKDTVSAKISYSAVDEKGNAGFNTGTSLSGGNAQSKLYTETWWNYGNVTDAGAKSLNLTVEAPTSVADLGLYVTSIDFVPANTASAGDLTEATVTASKSFGALDATVAYIYTDTKTKNSNDTTTNDSNIIQVYLSANF